VATTNPSAIIAARVGIDSTPIFDSRTITSIIARLCATRRIGMDARRAPPDVTACRRVDASWRKSIITVHNGFRQKIEN
jgi:hypothetical protein